MKKGASIFAIVLAAAAVYVAVNQAGLDIPEVRTETVKSGNIKISLQLTGELQPKKKIEVAAQTAGVVDSVHVSAGDVVESGELLFSLDSGATEKELTQAKKDLAALENKKLQQVSGTTFSQGGGTMSAYAQNALSLAQTSGYELFHFNNEISGVISQAISDRLVASVGGDIEDLIEQYLPQIESALSTEEAKDVLATYTADEKQSLQGGTLDEQIVAAQNNVATLEKKRDAQEVKSSMGGKVLQINVKDGQQLSAGSVAMVIADTNDMEILANISAGDVASVVQGMDVVIRSQNTNKAIGGVVSGIGQMVLNSQLTGSGNMTELVVAPTEKADDLPGSSMDIEIILLEIRDVTMLPLECLTDDGCVFVLNGDHVEKKEIETGEKDDYNVQVLSGLADGDVVVADPDESIEDGGKVKTVD